MGICFMMARELLSSVKRVVLRWLHSPKLFYAIVTLLALQAVWIALTARYPQAFDENYHVGLIQLHAQQWLPFFTSQPPGDALYGAVARDPSYLYHFLFSLPYRLLIHVTDSLAVQVIVLRLLNIALFVWGLYVYRKVLAELGASRAVSHAVLLFFVLTPIVPLLAGQINYDNLMFPMAGMLVLLTVRYYKSLQSIDFTGLPLLATKIIIVGALGSLVKFPFAPLFAATVIILAVATLRVWRRRALLHNDLAPAAAANGAAHRNGRWFQASRRQRIIVALYTILVVISLGLFLERYAVNAVLYHSPVPECHKVLDIDACQAYSPWARDYQFAATYPRPNAQGIVVYPFVWVHRMVYESMFTITSTYWEEASPNASVVYYYAADPLPVANFTGWAVLILGIFAAIWNWRRIGQHKPLLVILSVVAFYTLVLFMQNFAMYLHTGEAVAIHGRYIIPVAPVLYLTLVWSIGWALVRFGLERYKAWMFIIVFLLFLQGAGVLTWIVRGEYWWYWQQTPLAGRANWLAQDVLRRLILR